MDEQEQTVINLIVNAGSARSSAIEAIQYAKAGDIEKADESIQTDRKSTRLNSSHVKRSRMPSSA